MTFQQKKAADSMQQPVETQANPAEAAVGKFHKENDATNPPPPGEASAIAANYNFQVKKNEPENPAGGVNLDGQWRAGKIVKDPKTDSYTFQTTDQKYDAKPDGRGGYTITDASGKPATVSTQSDKVAYAQKQEASYQEKKAAKEASSGGGTDGTSTDTSGKFKEKKEDRKEEAEKKSEEKDSFKENKKESGSSDNTGGSGAGNDSGSGKGKKQDEIIDNRAGKEKDSDEKSGGFQGKKDKDTPPSDTKTPGIDNKTPGVDNKTPGGDNKTPGGDNKTPSIDNKTPGGDNKTPSIDNKTPGGDNKTPGDDGRGKVKIPEADSGRGGSDSNKDGKDGGGRRGDDPGKGADRVEQPKAEDPGKGRSKDEGPKFETPQQPKDNAPQKDKTPERNQDQIKDKFDKDKPGELQKQAPDAKDKPIDLATKEGRQALQDAIKAFEQGKVADLDPSKQKLAELLKNVSPEALKEIKALLEANKDKDRLDGASLDRLKELLGLGGKPGADIPGGGFGGIGLPRTPMDTLALFLNSNKDQLLSASDKQRAQAFTELTKLLGEYNKQTGPEKALTTLDVMRAMQDQAKTGPAAELGKALLGMKELGTQLSTQDALVKGALDRTGIDPHAARLDQQKHLDSALGGLKDLAGRDLAGKDLVGKDLAGRDLAGRDLATKVPGKDASAAAASAAGLEGLAALGGKDPSGKGLLADAALEALKSGQQQGQPGQPGFGLGAKDPGKDGKKAEDKDKDQDALPAQQMGGTALTAAAAADKAKEEEKQEEQKKQDDERRQKYIVQQGDTLESIASNRLRDRKLAPLIYEINQNNIPSWTRAGKKVLNLKPKLVLYLPTTTDIKDFRERPFSGDQGEFAYADQFQTAEEELAAWEAAGLSPMDNLRTELSSKLGLSDAASGASIFSDPASAAESFAAAQIRRENMEKLLGPLNKGKQEESGQIKYTVRLGDTLRSISLKHPALQNVKLWKLLAEINDLPTTTDAKGVPTVSLKRGMSLVIPSAEQIESFAAENPDAFAQPLSRQTGNTTGQAKPTGGSTQDFDIVTKPCPECSSITTHTATFCPKCGHSFAEKAKEVETQAMETASLKTEDLAEKKPTRVKQNADKSAKAQAKFEDADEDSDPTSTILRAAGLAQSEETKTRLEKDKPAKETAPKPQPQSEAKAVKQLIKELSTTCRLVTDKLESGAVKQSSLEIRDKEDWKPILIYEITETQAVRQEFTKNNKQRTIRIDLPPQAVQELAESDLDSNWQQYYQNYLDGKPLSE